MCLAVSNQYNKIAPVVFEQHYLKARIREFLSPVDGECGKKNPVI